MKKRLTATAGLLCLGMWLTAQTVLFDGTFTFTLHQQTRPYQIRISETGDSLQIDWKIYRNFIWLTGSYLIGKDARDKGTGLSWLQPAENKIQKLPDNETFGFISRQALKELHAKGWFVYNATTYRLIAENNPLLFKGKPTLLVVADVDHTKMRIIDDENLPLIAQLIDNPIEIDWVAE